MQPAGDDAAASEATRILRVLAGDPAGAHDDDRDRLLEIVYGALRGIAARYLDRERADHTLQPTALVHEAYLRLVQQDEVAWSGHAHFLGVAAQAMRRILVDHARAHGRDKRGGKGRQRLDADDEAAPVLEPDDRLVELDAALTRLAVVSPRQARVVELRYFGGLPVEQVAEVMDVSTRTVVREWRFAKAWLLNALPGEDA